MTALRAVRYAFVFSVWLCVCAFVVGVTFGAGALTIPAGVTSFTVSVATV